MVHEKHPGAVSGTKPKLLRAFSAMATTTRRIGPADHGQRMTLDEFADADFEDGWLYELARGAVVVTNVPGLQHGMIVYRLIQMFVHYADRHPGVITYQAGGSNCRIRLPGMQSDRHPDQAVYLSDPPPGENPWTRWIPDIVVEVVSTGGEERDYEEKREEYLRAGVGEYWIVDPASRTMLVLGRAGDTWTESKFGVGQTYRTHRPPGLEVAVGELFGAAEGE